MNSRLIQLISQFPSRRIDAYLVTRDTDVAYLTDFPASDSWLLVSPGAVYYITDARYADEVRQSLKGLRVYRYKESLPEAFSKIIQAHNVRRVGFDERHVSLALFKRLKAAAGSSSARMLSRTGLIDNLRVIKEKVELEKIRSCIALNLKAFSYLKKIIRPGTTERDIFYKLDGFVKSRGAGFSFVPIIASGSNSCFPHAKITGRKLGKNEPVLVDMGIDIEGYKSDLTRMFFLGKIPPHLQETYEAVQVAQNQAISKIRPGVPVAVVDQQAHNSLKKNKLDKYFTHSLGHGVGLEIHEAPRISQKSSEVIQKGMIFTVEPAVYLPGQFGIRIEDMVSVTEDGCEVLSR